MTYSKRESDAIRELGYQSFERAERLRLRSSYESSVNSHIAGKFGEHTCYGLLTRKFNIATDPVYLDENRLGEADLLCHGLRIDVKTRQEAFWDEFGRALAVSQWDSLRKKADIVFWCTFQPGEQASGCWKGWNWISDFDDVEPVWTVLGRHRVLNRKLPSNSVRSIEEFVALIANISFVNS